MVTLPVICGCLFRGIESTRRYRTYWAEFPLNVPNVAYKIVRAGVISAALLLALMAAAAVRLTYEFLDANSWVRHTTEVISEVRATRGLLGMAASAGSSRSAAEARIAAISEQLDRVARLTRDNQWQQKNIADFRQQIAPPPPGAIVSGSVFSPSALQAANDVLDRMQREEYGLLLRRSTVEATAMRNAGIAVLALCAGLIALGIVTTVTARREYHRRARAEAILQQEKQELKRYTEQLALVSAGSEVTQAAQDELQLSEAVAKVLRDLLPGSFGYFGLTNPSADSIKIMQTWGGDTDRVAFLPCSSCVALQLGRIIHKTENAIQAVCSHARPSAGDWLCIPLRSATGHLGLLHVETCGKISRRCADSVALFSAHIALALTNLRVREDLRNQSVRDPLTGLFNRRYFDHSLEREFTARRRDHTQLSVLMLDLDHFKRINDNLGHAAGDDVLRQFGRLLQSAFRENDIVCRYGGEEFAVILLHADAQDAYTRAEAFRSMIAQAALEASGAPLGPISTSVGLANSREFQTPAEILHAADTALYEAKKGGRNTTRIATSRVGDLPDDSLCAAFVGHAGA